jgi:hypothetical protein
MSTNETDTERRSRETQEAGLAGREEAHAYHEERRHEEEVRERARKAYREASGLLVTTPEERVETKQAGASSDVQEAEKELEKEAEKVTEEATELTAHEAVDLIKEAPTAEEVHQLSDGDERVTVQKAAEKRLAELEASDE